MPPFWQGAELHSLMLVWHSTPDQPARQVHEKLLVESTQVPPFWQGMEEHSLTLVSQITPLQPGRQVQE